MPAMDCFTLLMRLLLHLLAWRILVLVFGITSFVELILCLCLKGTRLMPGEELVSFQNVDSGIDGLLIFDIVV